jgi:hypothetical protein
MHYIGLEVGSRETSSKPKIIVRMFFDQHIYDEMAVEDVSFRHFLNYGLDRRSYFGYLGGVHVQPLILSGKHGGVKHHIKRFLSCSSIAK